MVARGRKQARRPGSLGVEIPVLYRRDALRPRLIVWVRREAVAGPDERAVVERGNGWEGRDRCGAGGRRRPMKHRKLLPGPRQQIFRLACRSKGFDERLPPCYGIRQVGSGESLQNIEPRDTGWLSREIDVGGGKRAVGEGLLQAISLPVDGVADPPANKTPSDRSRTTLGVYLKRSGSHSGGAETGIQDRMGDGGQQRTGTWPVPFVSWRGRTAHGGCWPWRSESPKDPGGTREARQVSADGVRQRPGPATLELTRRR